MSSGTPTHTSIDVGVAEISERRHVAGQPMSCCRDDLVTEDKKY